MQVLTTVLYLCAFSISIKMPDVILADTQAGPHEVFASCHSCHIDSCTGTYDLVPIDCDMALCWSGYICEPGYIREYRNGPCILPSECPSRAQH